MLKKILHNPSGLFGISVLAIFLAFALPGYLILPDQREGASTQFPELSAVPAGFQGLFFALPDTTQVNESWLSIWWGGSKQKSSILPIDTFYVSENQLFIRKYHPQKLGVTLQYNLNELGQMTGGSPRKTTAEAFVVKRTFWLGADKFGRDIFSRLVVGARITLLVGLLSVLISLLIGIPLGALAGYHGNRIDNFVMFFANVFWALPTLLLILAIVLAFGKGIWVIFFAIGLTMWVDVARMVRGQVMSLRNRQFVEAAKVLGYDNFRIIYRHILPHCVPALLVISTANFASAVLIESGLSYLGLGISPPAPSWGNMLSENRGFIITDKAWMAMVPGLAIMLLVLAFNLLGNALRDAFEEK